MGDDSKHAGPGIRTLEDIRREREVDEQIERRILETLYEFESDEPSASYADLRRGLDGADDKTFNRVLRDLQGERQVKKPGGEVVEIPPYVDKTQDARYCLTDEGREAHINSLPAEPVKVAPAKPDEPADSD